MGDHLKKVHPGQKLRIPAGAYNAFVDTAIAHRQKQQDRGGQSITESRWDSGVLLVRNDSGADRRRFDVLAVDHVVITPDQNEAEFTSRPCLSGVIPTETGMTRVAVLLQPLKTSAIGLAVVDGATIARVNVQNDQDTHCQCVSGQAKLKSGEGTIEILWKQSGTGEKWAIVRLGGAAPAGIQVNWGKATADWTSGNTVTLTPCVGQQDGTATGAPIIEAFIVSPYNAVPTPIIRSGDILAYITFLDANGTPQALLLPVPTSGLPAGTGQRKVLQLGQNNVPFWGYVEAI